MLFNRGFLFSVAVAGAIAGVSAVSPPSPALAAGPAGQAAKPKPKPDRLKKRSAAPSPAVVPPPPGTATASPPSAPTPPPGDATPLEKPKPKADPVSRSWVPIVGYNPTYKFFGGGGFFYERRDVESFGINGVVTQDLVTKIEAQTERQIAPRWRFRFHDEVARGFDPNYGAGNNTRAEDRVDVPIAKNELETGVGYFFWPRFAVGPFIDFKTLRREKLSAQDAARERDPFDRREDTLGFGLHEHLDYRNNDEDPSFGWYQELSARLYPSGTQSGDHPTFAQLETDIRVFQYLLAKELVIAYQLASGVSFNRPSYLDEFRLGGTDRLRGFYENRFRGYRYYLQQTEVRFPIFRPVGGATFLEFGETTRQNRFTNPSVSYGFGLRIGLPPDYLAKVRIDFAFSRDQKGVFLDFGHPF